MATGLQVWSQTAATNATADSAVNWAEGQAPSSVNDSARAEMAAAAKWRDDNNGTLVTTGSSSAFTATSNQVAGALTDGYTITLKFHATAGASATYAQDGLTAKPIQLVAGTNLSGGEIVANSIHSFTYTSTGTGQWVKRGHEAIIAGSIASGLITGSMIADVTINSTNIVDSTIATTKIAAAAITYAKIQNVSDGKILGNFSGGAAAPSENSFNVICPLYHVREQRATTVASSNAPTSGAWRTVVLTTEVTKEPAGVGLSSNVLSLPAGTYWVEGKYTLNPNAGTTAALRLFNTSDSATLLVGTNFTGAGVGNVSYVEITGRITLAGTKNVELQIRVSSNLTAAPANSFGEAEVYVDLMLWKVA